MLIAHSIIAVFCSNIKILEEDHNRFSVSTTNSSGGGASSKADNTSTKSKKSVESSPISFTRKLSVKVKELQGTPVTITSINNKSPKKIGGRSPTRRKRRVNAKANTELKTMKGAAASLI